MPTAPAVTFTKVSLRLPEGLYDAYAERAAKFGRTVEEEMTLRLRDCREHTASQPIYLNDDDRNALTQIAGTMIKNPTDVIAWAKLVSSIDVGGVEVELSAQLIKRLETRRFQQPMAQFLARTITEQLETYVGMR